MNPSPCRRADDAADEAQDVGFKLKHDLVLLAGKIDWDWIDGEIASLYREHGRPGIETRFTIGLMLLKHTYGLSDEGARSNGGHDRPANQERP